METAFGHPLPPCPWGNLPCLICKKKNEDQPREPYSKLFCEGLGCNEFYCGFCKYHPDVLKVHKGIYLNHYCPKHFRDRK